MRLLLAGLLFVWAAFRFADYARRHDRSPAPQRLANGTPSIRTTCPSCGGRGTWVRAGEHLETCMHCGGRGYHVTRAPVTEDRP